MPSSFIMKIMKHVLIIDETPLFREYLKLKLQENDIETAIGINSVDGISKMKNLIPDLIIMDANLSRQGYMEVLKQKKTSPNTANIPVILMAQRIDQKRLIEIIPYNVKKVFSKPVKIDALFITLSELLGVPFIVDETPGIVEVHVNDNIILIEIAQGLNRDKMDLLRFKILELIKLYEIRVPKIIIMLSDINLGFADGPNLEKLLDTVIKYSRAKLRHIRVLTMDNFTRQFVQGRSNYSDIEVVSNLQFAMDGLLTDYDHAASSEEQKAEIIGAKILSADNAGVDEGLHLKFDADSDRIAIDTMKESLGNLRIASIDDDFVIQELIKNTFSGTGAVVQTYSSGESFLTVLDKEEFDLVFLDLLMPNGSGFDVLKVLQTRDIKYPVIVLSSITQRETIIKTYQMGSKSFLVKPISPEDILKKSIEILKTNY